MPQIKKDHEKYDHPRWNRNSSKSHNAHAVFEEGAEEGESDGPKHDDEGDPERVADELEMEAEVLLTHAAKRRAAATQNRGFKKQETPAERSDRIAELKSRMPCSACKAKGITAYGHWHADPECPSKDVVDAKGKVKPVFVVSQDPVEDESEDDAFLVNSAVLATSSYLRGITEGIALADTCCARTVAGFAWAVQHMDSLAERGIPCLVVEDAQPFRFGDGPKVEAVRGIIFPLLLQDQGRHVLLRVSIVEDDVPLLVSSKALKTMGALSDLEAEKYVFKKVRSTVPMVSTTAGHIGFEILCNREPALQELLALDWRSFDNSMEEVAFGKVDQDRVCAYIPVCT